MRIACLQFAPQVGDVDNNLNRADSVLSRANPKDLDLLVLPELAFTGYNFKSLLHISPFLEPTAAGITSLWARTTALKYNCMVTVGYPEKVDVNPKWPTSPEYYNSAITVNKDGETVANYRKSFLYYTDETWALEGPDGFFSGKMEGLGNVAMGICMDLNPYKFEAPWNAWEFSYHVLDRRANLVIMSMAWLTREDPRAYSRAPKEPDMDTLSYWLSRLEPIIRAETIGEIVVVLANRTGMEGDATYAGTSAVLGIQDGEVKVYGILGRGERDLLIVDTGKKPQARLVSEPNSVASNVSEFSPTASSFFSDENRKGGVTVDTNMASLAHSYPQTTGKSPLGNSLVSGHGSTADNDFSNSTTPIDASSPVVASATLQQPRKDSLIDNRQSPRHRRRKILKQDKDSHSDEDARSSSVEAIAGDNESTEESQSQRKDKKPTSSIDMPMKPSSKIPGLPLKTKSLAEAVLQPSNRFASPRSACAETPIFAESPLYPARTSPMLRRDISETPADAVLDSGMTDVPTQYMSQSQELRNSPDTLEVAADPKRIHALSAMVIPELYQTSGTTSSFGPRSAHTSLRPKSNVW